MINRVLNKAMNCFHISPVFMSFYYLFALKPYLVTKNVSCSANIYTLGAQFHEVFFNSCAEMQSSSADAVQSQSTLRLKEIICLRFVYKILAMAFKSSVNDVKFSNAILSKFRNKVVFSRAYCQTSCKPETSLIQMNFSDCLTSFLRGDISKLRVRSMIYSNN